MSKRARAAGQRSASHMEAGRRQAAEESASRARREAEERFALALRRASKPPRPPALPKKPRTYRGPSRFARWRRPALAAPASPEFLSLQYLARWASERVAPLIVATLEAPRAEAFVRAFDPRDEIARAFQGVFVQSLAQGSRSGDLALARAYLVLIVDMGLDCGEQLSRFFAQLHTAWVALDESGCQATPQATPQTVPPSTPPLPRVSDKAARARTLMREYPGRTASEIETALARVPGSVDRVLTALTALDDLGLEWIADARLKEVTGIPPGTARAYFIHADPNAMKRNPTRYRVDALREYALHIWVPRPSASST